ncbi:MAG: hypothetical protein AAF548_05680 [Actinomycetota bacterium]
MTSAFRSRLGRDPRRVVTASIVGAVTLFVVWTMSPWAWFIDTTPTGGDMGAHVWSPKFLREELLPNFRLTGWSPDWYAGFPAFTFYMIIPSLVIVMINVGIEIESLGIDIDFYAALALILAGREIPRRLGFDVTIQSITMAFAAALSVAMSTVWDGKRIDLRIPGIEPFTFNDTSIDLALGAIALPFFVGLLAHQLAAGRARRRAVIVALAVVATVLIVPIPYGVAMKLAAISGIVTLPLAAYGAGRLGGLSYPGPAVLSVMTLPFLFDRSFNIYGGNVMSTMAGEFAYSMGLSIAVLYIGVAAKSLQTGRYRMLAAGLLALAGLTHLFAAFFALVVTVALVLLRPGTRAAVWLGVVGPIAGLLAAFWVLPFFWNRAYLNDMGWGKERDYVGALWNRAGDFGGRGFLENHLPLQIFVVLAVLGAVICGLRRVRLGMALALTAAIFAIAFILLPETRLWNVRILPFYYLSVYLLAGLGLSEIARVVADFLRTPDAIRERRPTWTAGLAAGVLALAVIVSVGMPLRSLPFGSTERNDANIDEYGFRTPVGDVTTPALNLGPSWMRYNFTGYEGRGAAWIEYSNLVATMDRVGAQFGCGQSLWEYDGGRLEPYGTPMAPMLLPHWTDGCIGSMEGLYFEASATTPYHFLLQTELSQAPSAAMRDMPYSSLDVALGVEGLQTMGVRYYMASTEAAISQARAVPTLTEIANSGPWVIFLVEDQALVVGIDHLPVVVDGVDAGGEEWLVPTVAWWKSGHDTPLVADEGPAEWPRSSYEDLLATDDTLISAVESEDRVLEMRRLGELTDEWLPRAEADVAQVSNIVSDVASISFEVDRVGTPVLVRASYFPNWEVSGADGPYRVSPNLMVVVPTDTSVELTYGRSTIELVAIGMTMLGIVAAFTSRRWTSWSVALSETDDLWDAGDSSLDVAPREEVLDDVRAGVVGHVQLDQLAADMHAHWSRGLRLLGVGAILLGMTILLSIVFDTGADLIRNSMIVFGPAVIGVFVLVFAAFPTMFEAAKVEYGIMRPARMLADVVNAEPPRVDVASTGDETRDATEASWSPPPDDQ